MVNWSIFEDKITESETVTTKVQTAVVRIIYDYSAVISAIYKDGVLRCEYHRPVIENSPFQGQIAIDEQRPMFLQVDDSEPIEIPVLDGVAEVPLEFEASGTYWLRITADFPCEPAELEVVV
jgi:hypothetical protein